MSNLSTYSGPHGNCKAEGLHAHALMAGSLESLDPSVIPLPLAYEEIHHPSHYNIGVVEHCEMVEDQGHADGYYFGQVTKYLFRAGSKPGQEAVKDRQKAQWYMNRWMAWTQYGPKIWKFRAAPAEVPFQYDPMAKPADSA